MTKEPTKKRDTTYLDKRLKELNIDDATNTIRVTDKDFPPHDAKYFEADKNGDIIINYFTPRGEYATYDNKGALTRFKRIRHANPELQAKHNKYSQPPGSGISPFITPGIITKVKKQTEIKTLFMIEGEFKAFAGNMAGLDIIGVGGVNSIREKKNNDLDEYIKEIINRCQVKNLVFIFDADLFQIKFEEKKDLWLRPNSFYSAVHHYKELCKQPSLNIDAYLSYINPEFLPDIKGLDDLLINKDTDAKLLIKELKNFTIDNPNRKYIFTENVSYLSEQKLLEFFKISNVNIFYKAYADILEENEFVYRKKTYVYDPESDGPVLSAKELHNFYKPKWDKKNGKFDGLTFKKAMIIEKLRSFGFLRYDIDIHSRPLFVRTGDQLIEETNIERVMDYFEQYIDTLPSFTVENQFQDETISMTITKQMVHDKFLEVFERYFSEKILGRLWCRVPLEILNDEIKVKYLFYNNCFLEITAEKVTVKRFEENNKFIWKNQIHKRDYVQADTQVSMAQYFCEKICAIKNKQTNQYALDEERFKSLKSILGYCMHSYNEAKRISIIFTDSKISVDGEPNGRTGKGLIGHLLKNMMNADKLSTAYCLIRGKSFDTTKPTRYELAGLDTQLIHIEDVKRNTNIEFFFNDITEGLEVRKMYSAPFIIFPKIVFSTYLSIKVEGSSAKGRTCIFELSDYFNDENTPDKEFNCWFFRDWDEKEYNRYDGFMIECIQTYLKFGLIEPKSINIEKKTLIDHTHPSFVDFMETRFKERDDEGKANTNMFRILDLNEIKLEDRLKEIRLSRLSCKEFYEAYCNSYPDISKKHFFEQKVFTQWVMQYIRMKDLNYNKQESDGIGYFYLSRKSETLPEAE